MSPEDKPGQSGKDLLSFKNKLHLHWGLLNHLPVLDRGWGMRGLGNIFVLNQPQPEAWKLIVKSVSRLLNEWQHKCFTIPWSYYDHLPENIGSVVSGHVISHKGNAGREQNRKRHCTTEQTRWEVGLTSSTFRCIFNTLICACTYSNQWRRIKGPEDNLSCLS